MKIQDAIKLYVGLDDLDNVNKSPGESKIRTKIEAQVRFIDLLFQAEIHV